MPKTKTMLFGEEFDFPFCFSITAEEDTLLVGRSLEVAQSLNICVLFTIAHEEDLQYYRSTLSGTKFLLSLPHNHSKSDMQSIVKLSENLPCKGFVFSNEILKQGNQSNLIHWLTSISNVPIIVKGNLSTVDIAVYRKIGVGGLMLSNGFEIRTDLKQVISTIGKELTVLYEGGIMKGTDIFKVLALGVKGVFLKESLIWGNAYKGKEGIEEVTQILRKELEPTMHLTGSKDIQSITPNAVVDGSYYWPKDIYLDSRI